MCSGSPPAQPSGLEEYVGQRVVVDTTSPYILLGTLRRVDRDYITLADADVHDSSGTTTTKDRYIMDASKLGVCVNRTETKVRTAIIISVSRLDDVPTF